jgi:hypothetical protein
MCFVLKINVWCSLFHSSLQDLSFFFAEAVMIESNCFLVLENCAFSAEVENFQQDGALHHYSDMFVSMPSARGLWMGNGFQSLSL